MRLRTANHKARRALRERPRWNRARRSYRTKVWMREVALRLARALDCPERPWFKLEFRK